MKQNSILSDRVPEESWRAAQEWEQNHWINAQRARARFGKNYIWRLLSLFGLVSRHRGDDWNSWWQQAFGNYDFLPPTLNNALEVGCGPYTNIRLIRERCRPKHLFLSDPLIRTYVKFKLTFVSQMYREAACMLDDHPLEELPFADDYFDLVVMINVLDHVRDAQACMESAIRVTKPGGFVVLGQDLSNDEDAEALRQDRGAVGHPVKLDHHWFAPYIERKFVPVINKILPREAGREPDKHYGTLLFAGQKAGVKSA